VVRRQAPQKQKREAQQPSPAKNKTAGRSSHHRLPHSASFSVWGQPLLTLLYSVQLTLLYSAQIPK